MFTRTPHMDQIFQKIKQRKQQTPEVQSRPTSNQTSNKDLLNSTYQGKSFNYHYTQLHQRLQSRGDIKKYLNESSGSQSLANTSYLIQTLKQKIGKRVQTGKHNTSEDTLSTPFSKKNAAELLLESESSKVSTLETFGALLSKMESKTGNKIFAQLKRVFDNVQLEVTSKLNVQRMEIETLCKQNVQLKQAHVEKNQAMQKLKQLVLIQQKQLKDDNHTLRLEKRRQFDHQDTCKIKQEQELQEEYAKYSSDDSIPLVENLEYVRSEKKGLSLNLNPLKDPAKAPIGYQDEFMSNINEFSESWRQQALAEKRF